MVSFNFRSSHSLTVSFSIKNCCIYPEGNIYVAFSDSEQLKIANQGNSPDEARANLEKTAQVYLQTLNLPITPEFEFKEIESPEPSPDTRSLPRLSAHYLIRVLERLGFHVSKSCIVLYKCVPGGKIVCVVPLHQELAASTVQSILAQAQIDYQEFNKNL